MRSEKGGSRQRASPLSPFLMPGPELWQPCGRMHLQAVPGPGWQCTFDRAVGVQAAEEHNSGFEKNHFIK